MSDIWLYSLGSVLIVSLISLAGILTFSLNKKKLKKIVLFLVSFSAGALFGDAFIHLLPEAVAEYGFKLSISIYLILGILVFFILEKFIHWRHCHIPTSKKHSHPVAFMNLIGDGVHNFVDGMVIAGSYLVNIQVGIATTVAVLLHEIPQEIGDFGVLIYAGFSKAKALFFNFLSALIAVLGAIVAIVIGSGIENFSMFLLPFTAGGFIYIAGSDLIPELHKECVPSKSLMQFFSLLLGIAVMLLLAFIEV